MNMKLKKLLNDIQKTEDKIAELQEHLKRQNTLRQQMEDIEIVKSFRSMKLDSRSLLVLLDGIQKGTVTIQLFLLREMPSWWMIRKMMMQKLRRKRKTTQKFTDHLLVR